MTHLVTDLLRAPVSTGVELCYQTFGDPDGEPLLLVMGLGGPLTWWDDALCLVFDGGEHEPAILDRVVKQAREIRSARFCTLDEVDELCADFTARRVRAALATLAGEGSAYTESGR